MTKVKPNKQTLINLMKRGLSTRDMTGWFGASHTTIAKWIKEHNITSDDLKTIKQKYGPNKKQRKEFFVKHMGGRCTECGYNKCNGALDFHHVGPKRYSISGMIKNGYSDEKVKIELEKCVLLCANCHRELHYTI